MFCRNAVIAEWSPLLSSLTGSNVNAVQMGAGAGAKAATVYTAKYSAKETVAAGGVAAAAGGGGGDAVENTSPSAEIGEEDWERQLAAWDKRRADGLPAGRPPMNREQRAGVRPPALWARRTCEQRAAGATREAAYDANIAAGLVQVTGVMGPGELSHLICPIGSFAHRLICPCALVWFVCLLQLI